MSLNVWNYFLQNKNRSKLIAAILKLRVRARKETKPNRRWWIRRTRKVEISSHENWLKRVREKRGSSRRFSESVNHLSWSFKRDFLNYDFSVKLHEPKMCYDDSSEVFFGFIFFFSELEVLDCVVKTTSTNERWLRVEKSMKYSVPRNQ